MKMKILLFLIIFEYSVNSQPTELEEYVADDSDISVVKHELLETVNGDGFITYRLNLTSLKWFNESFSDRPIWNHDVYISIPNNLISTNTMLYFAEIGLNTTNDPDFYRTEIVRKLSVECKCITIVQKQVPNQPIKFTVDPVPNKYRDEDEIMGLTFSYYFNNRTYFTGKTYNHAIILLPMVKSVKRGFDEVAKFLKSRNVTFTEKYVITGSSKRGWTSILVSAIDSRVVACAPLIYDMMNLKNAMDIHYKSLGAYSYAWSYYFFSGFTYFMDTLMGYELRKLVDPYLFLDRYIGKKLFFSLVANDDFFLLENTKLFWNDLRIITNNGALMKRYENDRHLMQNTTVQKIFINMISYLNMLNTELSGQSTLPIYTWKIFNNKTHASINVKLSNLNQFDKINVKAYQARTKDLSKVDFRLNFLNPDFSFGSSNVFWSMNVISCEDITNNNPKEYSYTIPRTLAENNYIGFYVDVTFRLKGSNKRFSITSDVNIIPEFYPFESCIGYECLGKLV